MPWTKIDDQFYDHPKVVAAGPLGIALFVCSLSYCARHLTDGFITATQAKRLIDVDDPLKVAEQLVAVGLWERRDGGYQVHDYLEYNPSADQVKAQRAANAERQAKWRGKQEPEVTGTDEGDGDNSNNVNNGVSNTAPIPIPMPMPKPASEERPAAAASVSCSIHNKPMTLKNKDGDSWYSHRLADKTWCKGAPGDQPTTPVDPRRYITGKYADMIQS